jgi:translation initiation factor 1 (eIF-1/SUI1)
MSLLVLLAALVLCLGTLTVIALVAGRIFLARDAQGQTRPLGCLAGCALALGLFLLGILALGVFLVAASVQTGTEIIENGPIERVGVWMDPASDPPRRAFRDPTRPLHLVFELSGHNAPTLRLRDLIEDLTGGDVSLRVENSTSAEGRAITVIDVALPADHDLRELERTLRKLLPDANAAGGVRIELRGSHRDW